MVKRLIPPTPVDMARHIRDLGGAFNVRLNVKPGMDPARAAAGYMEQTGQRVIMIAPVIDETTYAAALHELGHCLSPLGMVNLTEGSQSMRETRQLATIRDCRLQLEEEHAAWEWAEHYGLCWTPVMAHLRDYCLREYQERYDRIVSGAARPAPPAPSLPPLPKGRSLGDLNLKRKR